MAINKITYDSLLKKVWSNDKIKQGLITRYWDNSTQLKEFNDFLSKNNVWILWDKVNSLWQISTVTWIWKVNPNAWKKVSTVSTVNTSQKLDNKTNNPHVDEFNTTLWWIENTLNTWLNNKENIINTSANSLSDLIAKKNAGTITSAEKRQLDRMNATEAYKESINKNLWAIDENVKWQKWIAEHESVIARWKMLWQFWSDASADAQQQASDAISKQYAWWISSAEQYWIDKKSALNDKLYWADNALIDNQEELDKLISTLTDAEYAPLEQALKDIASGKVWAIDKVNDMILEFKKQQLWDQSTAVLAADSRLRKETEYKNATPANKRSILNSYLKENSWYLDDYIKLHPNYTSMTFSDVETWVAALIAERARITWDMTLYMQAKQYNPSLSIPWLEDKWKQLYWSWTWWTTNNNVNSTGTGWTSWNWWFNQPPVDEKINNWNQVPSNWVNTDIVKWKVIDKELWTSISKLRTISNPTQKQAKALMDWYAKNWKEAGAVTWPSWSKLVFDGKWNYSFNWSTFTKIWKAITALNSIADFKARWSKITDLEKLLKSKPNEYQWIALDWNKVTWYKWKTKYEWTVVNWDVKAIKIWDWLIDYSKIANTIKETNKPQVFNYNTNTNTWAWQLLQ